MEMTLRWYGKEHDTVTLQQIRQIPGVTGVITTLYDTKPGEVWERQRIKEMKKEVGQYGMHIAGIESVNVHDAIKTGAKEREQYIENYIETLKNLGEEDIHLVCYNFMPVFDWTRTELARVRPDGSTVLAYTQEAVDSIQPEKMFESISGDMNGTVMPGWEPERMAKVKELFEMYKDIDNEKLFANLKYFLERIMPVCDKYDINMAIHPDDPAWSVFGLPRIITNKENILRMMKMVDNPHNGVTFCTGSYGTSRENVLPDMIRALKGRIHFAHIRNLKFNSPTDFEEAAHLSADGSFDMYEIMKALYESGFNGPIRPDHGRMIWGEVAMPGYGLYDRALGATYLEGLWEAVEKEAKKKSSISDCKPLILSQKGIADKEAWNKAGYKVYKYDRESVCRRTKEAPQWIHFGAGNIFKAFQANAVQKLLDEKAMDKGLIVAEGYDYEIIEKINIPHDNLSVLVTLKADGSVEKTVVGSVVEGLTVNPENEKDFSCLKEIFRAESLQLVSFTITEKGYAIKDSSGRILDGIAKDTAKAPQKAESYLGKVAALLYERFLAGEKKLALVSMDNCSHNGMKLQEAILHFAAEWEKNGFVEKGFTKYLENKEKISFPWTMIDKITPRPDKSVMKILEEDGILDCKPIITAKNTYAAPFVNAEECEYLVIEDNFPNGRPPLERAGIYFTDRETVDKAEQMKVCTCLNPLHTALAVFGCILGERLISEEMKNPVLKRLVERIGYEEGLPVVVNPKIIEPKKFLEDVLTIRFPNPFMPDTPQRIATDTSQKLSIRFGRTLRAYRTLNKDLSKLKGIPLVFAGWLRYLMGIDDNGNAFECSPDPLYDKLLPYIKQLKFGMNEQEAEEIVRPILKNEDIFGVNLYEIGLAGLVCCYLSEMLQEKGAVLNTLKRYV